MSHEDTLATLRAQGADRHDPVRFRYLEALAARMATQPAAVRQVLARRFDAAVSDYCARAAGVPGQQVSAAASREREVRAATPLAGLNQHIARRRLALVQGAQASGDAGGVDDWASEPARAADLHSVRRFAQTWSKLATERQLAQALTRGPELAGPLNSHRLMLRALSLMHGLSPDYLRRFLAQADALLWLDHMNQQHALPGGKTAARRGRGKKSA